MAYDNFEVIEVLLKMIDDPRNDIFIHVDRSVKNFKPSQLKQACKRATIVLVPRIKVHWGHYSQIKSVFALLQEATKSSHSHYHLLSSSDLPIKSQDYIHEFCERNAEKEFVGFADDNFLERVKWFHFFNTYRRPANRGQSFIRYFFQLASSITLGLQRKIGFARKIRSDIEVKKGSDWFSITHELALHLLKERRMIRRLFRFAEIPTEFYVQTVVWNSIYRNRVFEPNDEYASCVRLVDWTRGNPYVFRKTDMPELLGSKRLFARKFLAAVDMDVVNAIRQQFSA